MDLQFNYDKKQVRTVSDENGIIYFVGIDICNILGYADAYQKIKSLDEDEYKLDRVRDGQGKLKDTLTVNEAGLYSLILTSTKTEAKKFKRWVTHEVLPAIRKSGKYTTQQAQDYEAALRHLATEIQNFKERKEEHQGKVNELRKKIDVKIQEMLGLIKEDRSQMKLEFPKSD